MKRISILVIVLMLSGSIITFFPEDPGAISGSRLIQPGFINAPLAFNELRINSETELGSLATSHNWEGNGSSGNPFVIENWNTETVYSRSGIYIGNTTSHIVLKNCDVSNGSRWGNNGNGIGFHFYNASNIEVKDSHSVSNRYSFFIGDCVNITLRNCNMSSSNEAVRFTNSNRLTVISCQIEIPWTIIYGYYSENIAFVSTNISYPRGTALNTYNCKNFRFEGCTIINHNSPYSPYLSMGSNSKDWIWGSNNIQGTKVQCSSSDVVFVNNSMMDSVLMMGFNNRLEVYNNQFLRKGIYFEPSSFFRDYTQVIPDNNTINGKPIIVVASTDMNGSRIAGNPGQLIIINSTRLYASNLSFDNISHPVSVHFTDHVRIENMTIVDAEIGILGSEIRYGLIKDNSITRTSSAAIDLYHMYRDISVSENIMINGIVGMRAKNIDYITIEENTARGFTDAGFLITDYSEQNVLFDNIIEENTVGIRIISSGSSYNYIEENMIRFNEKGIWILEEARRIRILNNNISQNVQYGIHLDVDTNGNQIRNNEFWRNGIHGVLNTGSTQNIFDDNHFTGTGIFIDMLTSSQSEFNQGNTMNGDPIIFIGDINYGDNAVPTGGGQYILEYVEDAIIRGLDIDSIHVPIIMIGTVTCWVTKCNISGSEGAGMLMKNTRACRIVDNLFRANRNGIEIFGDQASGVQSNRIESNRFEDNIESGIKATMYYGNKIRYNTFDNNLGSGINLSNCEANQIEENTIRTSGEDGIKMNNSRYNDIFSNVITGCIRGISLGWNTGYSRISGNLIQDNHGKGVDIVTSSNWNQVNGNAFIRNNGTTSAYVYDHPQAGDKGMKNTWNDSYGRGNYWSDLLTPDEDENGIVDMIYYLGHQEINDSAPLTELPFDLVSPPRGLEAISSDGFVNLSWKVPSENMAMDILGYNIYRYSKEHGEVLIKTMGSNSTLEFKDISMENNMVHWYSVSALNSYGEGARSELIIAYPDGEAPIIEIYNISDGGAIPTEELTIEWICYDNTSGLRSLKTKFEENGEWFAGPQNGSEKYLYLKVGQHSFFIEAVDIVGNINSMRIDFSVDLDDPELQILGPENGSMFNQDHFELTWIASDTGSSIDHLLLSIDNGTNIEYNGSNKHEFTGLTEGPHFIQIEAFDLAGNSVQRFLHIFIDMTPPVIDIPDLSEGSMINSPELLVAWSAVDPLSGLSSVKFKLDEGEWTSASLKQKIHVKGLTTGNHILTVMVTDRSGNEAVKTIDLVVDLESPRIIERYPEGSGIPVDSGIWVTFSEEMDIGSIEVLLDGKMIPSNWTDGRLETSEDLDLEYGTDYTVTIMGTDLSGNEIQDSSWDFKTVQGCCISGYIRAQDGSPIGNARIMLGDQGPYFTAFDGSFDINVRSGSFQMTIQAEGYEDHTRQVNLDPGGDDFIGTLTLKEVSTGSKDDGPPIVLIASITGALILIIALILVFLLLRNRKDKNAPPSDLEEEPEEVDIFEKVEESREIAHRLGLHIEIHESEYERAMELKGLGEEEMSKLAMEPYLATLSSLLQEREGPDGTEPPEIDEVPEELADDGLLPLEEPLDDQ